MSCDRRSLARRPAWLAAILCLALATGAARGAAAPAGDAEVQAQLRRVVDAIVGTSGDAAAGFDRLAEMAPSRNELLIEIAIFLRDARGTEEAMGGALVLDQLGFTAEEKIAAVVPRLDTPDPALRKVLYELLGTVDRAGGGEPEFGVYLPLLAGDSPAPGLIRYLYRVSPSGAVDAMRRAHPGAVSAGAERDVAEVDAHLRSRSRGERPVATAQREAAASLERLSRSPLWWLRLYAASALREEPALASQEIRTRLDKDENALVRSAGRD
jgi:hypothetical protein